MMAMRMKNQIFILEDDPLIAWDMEAELKTRGWQVSGVAANVTKFHELLSDKHPDAAVLDINLGKENSFEVARECVRQGIAVIFLSGADDGLRPEDLG